MLGNTSVLPKVDSSLKRLTPSSASEVVVVVVAQPQNTNASSRENAFLDLLFAIEDQTAETAATKELDAAEMEITNVNRISMNVQVESAS